MPHQNPANQTQTERAVVRQFPRRHCPGDGVFPRRDGGVVHRRQEPARPPTPRYAAFASKKNERTLSHALEELFLQARPSFSQRRTWERGRSLLFGALACLGRHTVSGLLCATGQQFVDWSAAYRLFEARRFDPEALFSPVRTAVLERLKQAMPVIASLDDTLVYKRGRKVAGASWRRDPLGPPFRPNFSWAQRFVQISLLLPTQGAPGPARAIPADLVHAPTAKKPSQNDPPELWEEYRQKQKQMRTSQVGSERIAHLRTALDDDERSQARELLVAVDGGYANQTFLRELPAKTTVVARIRKDARLFSEPAPSAPKRGRRRLYGERLPTPQELRHDESIP